MNALIVLCLALAAAASNPITIQSGDLMAWGRFIVTVLCVVVGSIIFIWKSQAAQNKSIGENAQEVAKLGERAETDEDHTEQLTVKMDALSADVSEIKVQIGKSQTLLAAQGTDIHDLKGDLKELLRSSGSGGGV